MNKVKIITDGCSDICKAWRDEYGIDYAPLTVLWNGEEKPVSCDWDTYSPKEFYDALRAGATIKSNQVSVIEFSNIFNKYLDEGYDIVYVGCTSALSGTVLTGTTVANSVMEERPGSKIICVDPPISCGGEALLAVEAAKLARQGKSAEEIAERVTELGKYAYQVGTVDTLTFLHRAGRVNASAAFFGNLMGIKPIIVNDENGANVAVKKIKGRRKAVDTSIAMLRDAMFGDQIIPVEEQTVYVGHADCLDTAEYIRDKIMETIRPKDVFIDYIGAAIGAAVGPTMVGLYAFGKPN